MSLERKSFKERVESKPEIERKFIIKPLNLSFLDLTKSRHVEILQGWYRGNINEKKLRIRKITDLNTGVATYERALKEKKSANFLKTNEHEEKITEEEFLKYFPECDYFIIKERFYYEDPVAGLLEIDVFRDRNLIIVEKEFKTLEEAEKFVPLPWFGKEVSLDKNYSNKNMAKERRGAR